MIILVVVGSALGFAVFALVGRFKRNKEASARISRRLDIAIGDVESPDREIEKRRAQIRLVKSE